MNLIKRTLWIVTIGVCISFYALLGKEAYNFYGDALGYYMYLPSTFIYNNHKSIEKLPSNKGIRPFIHAYVGQMGNGQHTPKGYVLNQYTYGVALMEMPFFFLAHGWEKIKGGQANGFSESYRIAVAISTVIYGILGLWVLYSVLRRRFSAQISSITTALVLIGTNLFWFMLHQHGMAHVPLFLLFSLVLDLTDRIHTGGRFRHFAYLGFTMGLITLIRPIDGLCVLLPLCYHTGRPFLRTKASFIRLHFLQILVCGLCFLVPIIPQLAYWKWLTGHTIYDSYGPNQGFDFLHPHIWAGIFSASNGWLFYTPLMLFALIGFCFAERWRVFLAGAALLLLTYTWAVYSWFLPNYINGLGSRPMIDIYPVLALPLAAFLNRLHLANRVLKYTGAAIIMLFVFVNISYSAKKALGLLDTEHSNYAFNIATFFRYGLTYNDLVLWDINVLQPQPQKLLVTDRFCTSVKDSAYSSHVIFDTVERSRVYFVQDGEEYAPLRIKISGQELMRGKARWIHCSGRFRTTYPESDIFKNHLLVLRIFRGDKNLHWFGCRINNKVGLKENAALRPDLFTFRTKLWGEVDYYVPVPDDLEANDQVQLDIWNIGKRPLYISNLCLSICK